MGEYTEECINTFLMNQGQLFDEPVAENYDEAEAFLEDCFAVVADNLDDVRAYMEEEGMDVEEMSDAELEEQSEVFALPDVSVADTGIGIAKEDQERIFERFYRVDKSHSRETGGTGLGLSIVKHGAILHDAKIKIESTLGTGTKIILEF